MKNWPSNKVTFDGHPETRTQVVIVLRLQIILMVVRYFRL